MHERRMLAISAVMEGVGWSGPSISVRRRGVCGGGNQGGVSARQGLA